MLDAACLARLVMACVALSLLPRGSSLTGALQLFVCLIFYLFVFCLFVRVPSYSTCGRHREISALPHTIKFARRFCLVCRVNSTKVSIEQAGIQRVVDSTRRKQ